MLKHTFRAWDEDRVVQWLKTINAGQYAETFKGNVNPPCLLLHTTELGSKQYYWRKPDRSRSDTTEGDRCQQDWGSRKNRSSGKAVQTSGVQTETTQ